jgi:DNA-binding NarL/FixJ family response regulator
MTGDTGIKRITPMSVTESAELTICLASTSPDLVEIVTQFVGASGDLRVSSVVDPTTDLTATLRREGPDFVVLDFGTCSSLLENIKRVVSRLSRKAHIVVLTARMDIAEREALLSSGVDFVFTKVRPMAELGPVLRRLGPAGSVSQHLQAHLTESGAWWRALASSGA